MLARDVTKLQLVNKRFLLSILYNPPSFSNFQVQHFLFHSVVDDADSPTDAAQQREVRLCFLLK